MINTKSGVWIRLYIYSKRILICPLNGDYSELSENERDNDIIILSDIPENFEYNGEYIIISSYENVDLQGINADSISTNGHGRIDLYFNSDDTVGIKQVYTGGVTRYAKN